MYQPLNPIWFFASFLAVLMILGILAALQQQRRWALPRWALVLLAAVAALQLLLAGLVGMHNERQMRLELQRIPATGIAELTLSRSGVTHAITNPAQAAVLSRLIQTLQPVPAHHSYPLNPVDIAFVYQGTRYHYQVGRDSQRPTEFWILDVNRSPPGSTGRELGRVESSELGAWLDRLTAATD